jgi:hypothetical protein
MMENTCTDQTTIEIQSVTKPVAQPVMTLEDYAKVILEAHRNCEALDKESKKKGREAVQWAYKAGQYLNAIKEKKLVPHGQWLPWLKQNCPEIKERTAQRYMVAAKNVRGSDLEHFTGVRQYEIATGARSPEKIDKAPDPMESEAANTDDELIAPEILLGQMQRGFSTLQKQYTNLVTLHPKLETQLLSIDLNWSLPVLLQRWQYPLGDAFDYFKLPWTPAVCVRCGHIRQDEEIFVPIHHWVPEYAQRNEWCEVCAEEYYDNEEPFDLTEEIKMLKDNLTELKAMNVKDYEFIQKWYQLKEKQIAEPAEITAAENNVWLPVNLDDEQLTCRQIETMSPRIVIMRDEAQKRLWEIYKHCVASCAYNRPPTHNVQFIVVDDSQPNKPVLGIGAISGDFMALKKRDDFIGWTPEQRIGDKLNNIASKLNHTAVGSTIIATQPFGYNFVGGKLIAALITSQLIRDEWKSVTGNVLSGLTTTSLFGALSMYNGIKQWKCLDESSGRVPIQPRPDIYRRWKDFLAASRLHQLDELTKREPDDSGPITNEKAKVLALIFKAAGLRLGDFEHGHKRGVYFSEFYENTKDFLCGRVTEDALQLKPLFQESVEQITDRWRKHAITRYGKLKADGKLKPEKCSYSQLGKMDFETARKVFLDELKESSE